MEAPVPLGKTTPKKVCVLPPKGYSEKRTREQNQTICTVPYFRPPPLPALSIWHPVWPFVFRGLHYMSCPSCKHHPHKPRGETRSIRSRSMALALLFEDFPAQRAQIQAKGNALFFVGGEGLKGNSRETQTNIPTKDPRETPPGTLSLRRARPGRSHSR